MPLTFPSHAAAVWPLQRFAPRVLPAAALIVGSCAPDLGYLFEIDGRFTHSLRGSLFFALPMGLVVLAWLDLVSPTLRALMPPRLGPCFEGSAFPRSVRGTAQALVALWLGTLTHLAWDGFTHRTRWPATVLYPTVAIPLPFTDRTMLLANVLQHLSTIVGAVIVYLWFRALPVATGPSRIDPTSRGSRIFLVVMVFAGVGIALGVDPTVWAKPWALFWRAAQGAFATGTLACVAIRVDAPQGSGTRSVD
jgi:hypothetical protein